jgi:hypothetical protein
VPRKTAIFVAGLLLGFLAGKLLGAPSDEVRAAVADLRTVPQERWASTRYLSLANVPEDERASVVAIVHFVANSTGSSPTIVAGVPLRGDILRLHLDDYRINPVAWEALAGSDPYFHLRTKVIAPKTQKETVVFTDAGHVGLENAAALRKMTGSAGALLRADWFITHVTTDHYYSFAAIPDTLDGWYQSLGVDKKTIVALQANRGANIFRSAVTQKPRRVSRYQGPLGGVWNTYDSADSDDPRKDPFRFPAFDSEYDAGEFIATKPNGLHVFGLYDRKGKRQDSVPDTIAKDTSDPLGDGRLVPMLSCVRCHTAGGYRVFSNDMAGLLKGRVDIKGYDVARLAAFYSTDRLAKELDRDQEDYAVAVAKATCGKLTAKELPEALGKIVRGYAYETVNADKAMRDLGSLHLEFFKASNDPYLLSLFEGKEINRRAWEASYHEAATLQEIGR